MTPKVFKHFQRFGYYNPRQIYFKNYAFSMSKNKVIMNKSRITVEQR